MQKFIIAALIVAAVFGPALTASAQAAPYQDEVSIASGSTTVTWEAPAATYGPLLSLQTYNMAGVATLAVSHIVKASSAISLTNTVETAAAGGTLLTYPSALIYACTNTTTGAVISYKPVWIVPGDKLVFTASVTNGRPTDAIIVIRAGHPGN